MTFVGMMFFGEAGSSVERVLVLAASIAGIVAGVLPARWLARSGAAVNAVIVLCGLAILSVLGQAIIFYTSYDSSGSGFAWPLLVPYCIALGVIINELSEEKPAEK